MSSSEVKEMRIYGADLLYQICYHLRFSPYVNF